ncbi:hypothetical protein STANM309S_02002 [Streptomyces tanashiensis]
MPEALAEADRLQRLGGPGTPLGGLDAERDEGGLHVLLGGERGDEVEALEDEADGLAAHGRQPALGERGQVGAVEQDAARGGAVEAAEHLEEGGLAAARGALDDETVPLGEGEVDPGERVDSLLSAPVLLGDADEFVHGGTPVVRGWVRAVGYSTRRSASAGRSREARQAPKAPATSPPPRARRTARPTVVTLTGAVRAMSTVLPTAVPGSAGAAAEDHASAASAAEPAAARAEFGGEGRARGGDGVRSGEADRDAERAPDDAVDECLADDLAA